VFRYNRVNKEKEERILHFKQWHMTV